MTIQSTIRKGLRVGGYLSLVAAAGGGFAACSGGKGETDGATTGGLGGKGAGGMSTAEGGKGGAGTCSGTSGFDEAPTGLPPLASTGVFVVNHWYLGDTNAADAPDSCAWMNLGLDLDGLKSNGSPEMHCTPIHGPIPDERVETDGHDGIDNAFGHFIVPFTQQAISNLSAAVNASLKAGWSTLMIRADVGGKAQAPQTIPARLYFTAPLIDSPGYDGADVFPIESDWLQAGSKNPDDSVTQDLGAQLDGDRLTIAISDDSSLYLKFKPNDFELGLTAHHVRIVLDMDPTHAHVTRGTIAGVFLADEAFAEVKRMLGNANSGLCDWTQFKSGNPNNFLERLRNMQDILADGTNHAGEACNAISFGIGFRAVAAQLGTVETVAQPPTDPCGQ